MPGHDAVQERAASERTIAVPAPTAWPIVLAFGLTLVFAGLVTSPAVSVLGCVLSIAGVVGWFRELFPQEAFEIVPAPNAPVAIVTTRPQVDCLVVAPEVTRVRLPIEIYPITAGVKGGLAGGAAMALLASLYGAVRFHSIWYPINLLAAGASPVGLSYGMAYLRAFHWGSLLLATAIHLITSLLVGLLYGAMLPMLPRHPILLGGVFAPVVWTGFLHTVLDFVSPVLNAHIAWTWFVVTQIGFGIVAGLVVCRQAQVCTRQFHPLAMRAGLATSGAKRKKPADEGQR